MRKETVGQTASAGGIAAGKTESGSATSSGKTACSPANIAGNVNSEDAIVFRGVSKSFGENRVLREIDLTIPTGQFAVLLGPNGAGKTTLVRLLAGVYEPDCGSIEVLGKSVDPNKSNENRLELGVQNDGSLYEQFTAYENLDVWAEFYGLSRVERAHKINALLDFFGLQEKAHTRIKHFSKGMKQQVAIARAIVHNPKVLILDEPTSGLDPLMADKVLQLLQNLQRESGMTILMCTHRLEMVEEIAGQLMILHGGRMQVRGAPSALLLESELADGERGLVVDLEVAAASFSFDKWERFLAQYEQQRHEAGQPRRFEVLHGDTGSQLLRAYLHDLQEIPVLSRELVQHFDLLRVQPHRKTIRELYTDVIAQASKGAPTDKHTEGAQQPAPASAHTTPR